jgi:ADP-ribose pyrophosphatase
MRVWGRCPQWEFGGKAPDLVFRMLYYEAMKPPLPSTPDIRIQSQDIRWDGRATLRLVNFTHRRFNGAWSAPITWELWQRGRAAAMLPYDPITDRVVMIEQFRLPAHAAGFPAVMREIPAGLCETGENAEATIRREMQEEAGISARRAHHIGDFILAPGGSDETITIFAGEVTAPDPAHANDTDLAALRDVTEDIRVLVLPADEAIDQAITGQLNNSVAVIGLLWLAARRPFLRNLWS